jgi:tetratricopeptide (TPR) repeat protein
MKKILNLVLKIKISRRKILVISFSSLLILIISFLLPLILFFYYQSKGVIQIYEIFSSYEYPENGLFNCSPGPSEFNNQNIKASLDFLQKTSSLGINKSNNYLHLGRVYCFLGDIEKAVESYINYIDIRTKSPIGYLELGFALGRYCLSDNFNQKEVVIKNISAYCENPDLLLSVSDYWKESGITNDFIREGDRAFSDNRYNEAVVWFQRAVIFDLKSESTWEKLGESYNQLGELNIAVGIYKKSLQFLPNKLETYYKLGIIYKEEYKDYGAAVEYFKLAAELDPYPVRAYTEIGISYDKLGAFNEAEEAFLTAIHLNSDIGKYFLSDYDLLIERVYLNFLIGDFLFRADKSEESMPYLNFVIQEDQSGSYKGWSLWSLGRIAFLQGQLIEAENFYREALEFSNNFYHTSQVYAYLGIVLLELDRANEGIIYLRMANEKHPENMGLHKFLAQTLKDLGWLNEALIEYQKYLEHWPNDQSAIQELMELENKLIENR